MEVLEQLQEREAELNEQHTITIGLEDKLVTMKQQMAALIMTSAPVVVLGIKRRSIRRRQLLY